MTNKDWFHLILSVVLVVLSGALTWLADPANVAMVGSASAATAVSTVKMLLNIATAIKSSQT